LKILFTIQVVVARMGQETALVTITMTIFVLDQVTADQTEPVLDQVMVTELVTVTGSVALLVQATVQVTVTVKKKPIINACMRA